MINAVLGFLARYGYVGLAAGVLLESAGIPVPGETALLAAAVAASHGALELPLVMLVAALAGILGDNAGYVMGRRLGRPWLETHDRWLLITPARLEQMDRLWARFGAPAVALARFFTGVRVVAAFSAGMARMRWPTFLLYNTVGAVAWSVGIGLLGYSAGRGYAAVAQGVGRLAALLLVAAAGAAAAWVLARRAGLRSGRPAAEVRAHARRTAGIVGAALAAAAVFAKLAEDVAGHETGAFDGAIRDLALRLQAPAPHLIFSALTWLGSVYVVAPATVLAVSLLWRRIGVRAVAAAAPPLVGGGLIELLKVLFHRVRPTPVTNLLGVSYSFPSGHTTAATGLSVILAYILVRERLVRKALAVPLAAAVPLLVGISRVYLDVHWATDVIAGWAAGSVLAALGIALYEWLRARAVPSS